MRALIRTALIGLALMQCQGVARAEGYPSRPVTLMSPYAAGGGTDLLARLLATRLEARRNCSSPECNTSIRPFSTR